MSATSSPNVATTNRSCLSPDLYWVVNSLSRAAPDTGVRLTVSPSLVRRTLIRSASVTSDWPSGWSTRMK